MQLFKKRNSKDDLAKAQDALKNNSGDALTNFQTKLGQFNKAVDLPEGSAKSLLDKSVLELDKKTDVFSQVINDAVKATSNLPSQVERTARAISNAEVVNT